MSMEERNAEIGAMYRRAVESLRQTERKMAMNDSFPPGYFEEVAGGSGSPLTISQKRLIDAAIKNGMSPARAVAEYAAVPSSPLPGHRPVYQEFITEDWPFIQSVLVGYEPIEI